MNNQKTMAIQFANNHLAAANREYKSTTFSLLYDDRNKLLSLYNALNHSHYSNPQELEIVTLTNAVYMGMKNDKAFVLDYRLNLYEHQSTPNPNMPLRHLLYVVREYGRLAALPTLYRRTPVQLPTPRFVVFYNGLDRQPEKQVLKLSDLYIQPEEEPMLELKVEVLNINAGYNEELKEACESLKEYCLFVDRVRHYTAVEETLKKAVDRAVKECIEEGILKEFLIANRGEVMAMSLLEFTLEDWLILQEEERELACEEARAKGLAEGLKEGRTKGHAEGLAIGHAEGHAEGLAIGHAEGHAEGYVEGEQSGEKRGIQIERENSVKIFVAYLKKHLPDFEAVFQEVTSNENYSHYTREQLKKYYENQ